jgi:hypothetical protein
VDVDAIAVGGEWIRHVPHRSALLGRSEQRTDGRWQHATVVRGLYLDERDDLRATATSAVGGDQEIPKMGVLTPLTRAAISENFTR